MRISKNELIVVILGMLARVFVWLYSDGVSQEYLIRRIEFLSSQTSYTRVIEGKYLIDHGLDPYGNNFFHLSPIAMAVVHPFMTSRLLYFAWLVLMDGVSILLLTKISGRNGILAGMIYALNPYSILSPSALSGQSMHVLVSVLLLHTGIVKRSMALSTLFLAFLMILKPVSPMILVFALAVVIPKAGLVRVGMLTLAWFGVLHMLNYGLSGFSWSYFYASVIAPIYIAPDVEPNMGIVWCIYSVIFPFSLGIFRFIYQTHLFLVVVPGYIRLSDMTKKSGFKYSQVAKDRFLVLMLAAVLLFQTYPTSVDFCLIMALLAGGEAPVFVDKTVSLFTQFIIAPMVFSSATATLWLERNSGNMNYLFNTLIVGGGVTAYAIAQSLKLVRINGYYDSKKNE